MICGITTAPRTKCFLEETVSSAYLSGFRNLFVFAEPKSEISDRTKRLAWIMQNGFQRGQWGNWFYMATRLCGLSSGIVMTAEDDVHFSKHAARDSKEVLENLILEHGKECGPLCVYTSSIYQDRIEGESRLPVEQIDSRSLIGACALLWPIQALRRIVEHRTALIWRGISGDDSGSEIRHTDTCIGICCHELELKVFGMYPCHAQHIGVTSSLGRDSMDQTMFASHVAKP